MCECYLQIVIGLRTVTVVRVSVATRPTVEQVTISVSLAVAAVRRDTVDDSARQRNVQV